MGAPSDKWVAIAYYGMDKVGSKTFNGSEEQVHDWAEQWAREKLHCDDWSVRKLCPRDQLHPDNDESMIKIKGLLKKDSGGRDRLERLIDKHNHKLEVIRTVGSIIAASTSLLVFLRIFNFI